MNFLKHSYCIRPGTYLFLSLLQMLVCLYKLIIRKNMRRKEIIIITLLCLM